LRISTDQGCCIYVPDVAEIPNLRTLLRGIDVYIGDGATIRRSMVRRTNRALIGHASIVAQLEWCKEAGVRQAFFTHCGSAIVRGSAGQVRALVRQLGLERGIDARLAHDGLELGIGHTRLPRPRACI
jgi:hypothetical protein